MISSMTAFARSQRQGDWGSLVCEMRSINHRYLEISSHLPDMLRLLEMPIREQIRQHIKRGKIEYGIRFQPNQQQGNNLVFLNTALASELCRVGEHIRGLMSDPENIAYRYYALPV